MNIPNGLTLLRISLIPIFMIVFYLPFPWRFWVTAVLFALAAITDWLDGYLARRLNQVSTLGEFLDPVADKLMVAAALVLLVQAYASPYLALPAVIIVSREIAISALREWMAELGKRKKVAVSYAGKLKTAAQMIAIVVLLSQDPRQTSWLMYAGYVLLYVSVVLTLSSMLSYLKMAWQEIKNAEPS